MSILTPHPGDTLRWKLLSHINTFPNHPQVRVLVEILKGMDVENVLERVIIGKAALEKEISVLCK